jgi:hypothetical protein
LGLEVGFFPLEPVPALPFRSVSDVAVDADGLLYVLSRGPGAVVVYRPDGRFLRAFGEGAFVLPHGVSVGPDGRVLVVDQGAHALWVFSPDGTLERTVGTPGQPSDSGCEWDRPTYKEKYLSIGRGAGPFNNPTKAALAPDGTSYVTDGYGNARVHRFSASWDLLASFGEPGSAPGEFRLPHGLCVTADGRVVVADRENERLQLFEPDGSIASEWPGFQRPAAVCPGDGQFLVGEAAWKAGDFSFALGERAEALPGGFTLVDDDGRVLARYRSQPEERLSPHGLARTADGRWVVAEVAARSAAGAPAGREEVCGGLVAVGVARPEAGVGPTG